MKAVRIIRDPETIKLLADLVRRQILRLISDEPHTQVQLAKKMMLTEPSMSHHLHLLSKAGLIRIKLAEVGPHGILQNYYEPTAKLFIEDWDKIPPDLRRYFVHNQIERLRGMLSVFQLLAEALGQSVEVRYEDIEELAQAIERRISAVGEKYETMEAEIDREMLLIKIYSETLKEEMTGNRWKDFFLKIGGQFLKQSFSQ